MCYLPVSPSPSDRVLKAKNVPKNVPTFHIPLPGATKPMTHCTRGTSCSLSFCPVTSSYDCSLNVYQLLYIHLYTVVITDMVPLVAHGGDGIISGIKNEKKNMSVASTELHRSQKPACDQRCVL